MSYVVTFTPCSEFKGNPLAKPQPPQHRPSGKPARPGLALFRLVLVLLVVLQFSCSKTEEDGSLPTPFDTLTSSKLLQPLLSEVSGIADSKVNPGFLWTEEDSGNPPRVSLVRYDGTVVKSIYLKGAVNRDWEDMALLDGQLYVADIGDNTASYGNYRIYRFAEPAASVDTVAVYDTIPFRYADGARDAEAFLVDSLTKDIYLISKWESRSGIYRISWPYSTSTQNTAVKVGELPYNLVVSATQMNNELLVKTYAAIYYYRRAAGSSLLQTLLSKPVATPYVVEAQGEAVALARNGSGFFTLSEIGGGSTVMLNFYRRK